MKIIKFLILVILLQACNKFGEDINPSPCIEEEITIDTTSGFLIFDKGEQKYGTVNGMKINLPFEGSVQVGAYKNYNNTDPGDSIYTINIATFWPLSAGYAPAGESIFIKDIKSTKEPLCFDLTNNPTSSDSTYISYRVIHGDVPILNYRVDESADNKLELIFFDSGTRKLTAKFNASFIADTALLPEFPQKVRFYNVLCDTY